ncbi:MAG: FtsX-like permease family protein [Lactimicrobium sp.]|jgi:hypothetical protein|uniref:FtsX-like permease family protein n=1 Tax=Lactimicrobium sp. TaxID=2563780 RepID=UPI002F3557EA
MIFASALKSLKRDFYRSFFYWLTFLLTTAFVFLFFCIAVSPAVGMTFTNSEGGLAVNVTFFAVFVCVLDVFFANDFFVRTKAKDLAVQLICGATFTQLAWYLLVQTFLLLALAIPGGIVLALLLRPLLVSLMSAWLHAGVVIPISGSAVWATLLVLLALVFWTTYLNLSYAYRNNAYTLLNSQSIRSSGSVFNVAHSKKAMKVSGFASGIIALALWILPVFGVLNAPADAFVFALFGMIGFWMCCRKVFDPLLTSWLDKKAIEQPKQIAILGFFRTDLSVMNVNVILIVICSVVLISLMSTPSITDMEKVLMMLAYQMMNVLLSLAILFRFGTEALNRKKYFQTMRHLGYLEKDLKKIVAVETISFYCFVALSALLYVGVILKALAGTGVLTGSLPAYLIWSLVLPLALCMFATWMYYRGSIRTKRA